MEPRYQCKCVAPGGGATKWKLITKWWGVAGVLMVILDWGCFYPRCFRLGGWGSKHTKNTPKIMVNSKITSNTWVGQKHQELGWGFETIGWAIELYTVVHITCMKYCSAPKFHTHNIYFLHYFFTKYNIYPKIWFLLRFFTSRRFTSHWTSLVYNNSRYYHVLRKYMRKRIVA